MVLGVLQLGLVLGGIVAVQGGFTTTSLGPKPIWNATMTDRLRQDLLLNYDKFARPAQPFNATTVKFAVTLRHLDVNELKSSFTIHCFVRLVWTDEKLKWNTSDYGNITNVHLADHEIWQPDIFIYNSATAQAINSYGNTHTIVHNNGEVLWVPPAQFTALCNVNLRYWPFDKQTCYLKFGSWTYHGNQINLIPFPNTTEVDSSHLFDNNEWKMLESSVERNLVYYSCCSEPYPDITISITVARISPSYNAVVITPAFAVIFLILMTFWLPPQAGEKIILQGCTAIIICMFLLYFTQKLPAMGSNTPLIVLFYSASLYVVCFSLMSSIAVIWLSRTPHTLNLPWKLKQTLTGWLGKVLGLGHYIGQASINTHRVTAEEMRDHQANSDMDDRGDHQMMDDDRRIIDTNTSQASQQDWVLLAAAIDRLSFYGYSVLFAIMAIAYSL